MPTVADTIDILSGYISFTLSTAPFDGASGVASGRPKLVATDANGAFSTTLGNGYFTVRIPHTPAFTIWVPASGGPYDLEDLTTSTATSQVLPLANAAAAAASYSRPQWILLSSDGNGDPAAFEYDETGDETGTYAVDWINTAEDRIYRRTTLQMDI